MARYKRHNHSQEKFISMHFDKQIFPWTFEHTLHYPNPIDNEIDPVRLKLRFAVLSMLLVFVFACAKEIDLTSQDQACIFMPEDVENLDLSQYRFKTYTNGKNYTFLRTQSDLNGLTDGYRRTLIDKQDREIIFTTNINVQSSEERAKELFNISKKMQAVIGKEYVVGIDPQIYGADELFLLISKNQYYMVLRKAKLVYSLNIEGMAILEQQVRNNLRKKFESAFRR